MVRADDHDSGQFSVRARSRLERHGRHSGDLREHRGEFVHQPERALLLLYLASTLYHAIQHPVAKGRLKVFDHCAIYLLIAGTYTPLTLVGLRGSVGWWLFGAIWALALAGVVFKLFYTGRFKKLSTAIYIAMGWLVVVAIKPMWQSFDGWTLGWLFAGGLAYTLGTYFYHRESVRYSHAIWHLFVLAGSVCHYIAVLALVVPAR